MSTINREAAIAYSISGMTREIDGDKWIRVSEVRESIKTMPSAEPINKGLWVKQELAPQTLRFCSLCGCKKPQGVAGNFCPNCGASMDGERKENDE